MLHMKEKFTAHFVLTVFDLFSWEPSASAPSAADM